MLPVLPNIVPIVLLPITDLTSLARQIAIIFSTHSIRSLIYIPSTTKTMPIKEIKKIGKKKVKDG
jgi:hypothetical protein